MEIIERKIGLATDGLQRYVTNWLRMKTSPKRKCSNYIRLCFNPSQNYKKMQIQALVELSDYLQQKPFKQLTTEDVLSFLDKFRKTVDKDPLHKWIGTYNLKREILRQFFTWLNDPFTERSRRSRPKIMENIPQFKRKKISIYKPSNLWTEQDDALSRDSSYRPQMMHRLSCEAISTILLEVRIEY
jgi:hypothetical protein